MKTIRPSPYSFKVCTLCPLLSRCTRKSLALQLLLFNMAICCCVSASLLTLISCATMSEGFALIKVLNSWCGLVLCLSHHLIMSAGFLASMYESCSIFITDRFGTVNPNSCCVIYVISVQDDAYICNFPIYKRSFSAICTAVVLLCEISRLKQSTSDPEETATQYWYDPAEQDRHGFVWPSILSITYIKHFYEEVPTKREINGI